MKWVTKGLLTFFAISLASPVWAGKIVFGFNDSSAPFSSSEIFQGKKTGDVIGFCRHLADFLEEKGFQLDKQPLNFDERLAVFAKDLNSRKGIQCGSNTITRQRKIELNSKAQGFTGEFSKPFLITTAKLLIRSKEANKLYYNPEALTIGVLKAGNDGFSTTTTVLIEKIFPAAQTIYLETEMEAVKRLNLPSNHEDAIDAYASDELILHNMYEHDIVTERKADYQILPKESLFGYSWEAYGIAVYNAPELTKVLNQWLSSDAGKKALLKYIPKNTFTHRCSIQEDCLYIPNDDTQKNYSLLLAILAALATLLAILALWQYRQTKKLTNNHDLTENSDPPPESVVLPRPLLTPRETEVLALLIKGNSSKEIARELGDVSPRTIETHRQKIYEKLGSAPYELVEYAQLHNII